MCSFRSVDPSRGGESGGQRFQLSQSEILNAQGSSDADADSDADSDLELLKMFPCVISLSLVSQIFLEVFGVVSWPDIGLAIPIRPAFDLMSDQHSVLDQAFMIFVVTKEFGF